MKKSLFAALILLPVTACQQPADNGDTKPAIQDNSIPCPFADHADLKAWVDTMPIGGSKLIVTGRVLAPFDDYAGTLKDSGFIKVFPPIQLLDLTLVETPGAKKGWQDIRYEGDAQPAYDSVVITCHGKIFAQIRPVKIVQ